MRNGMSGKRHGGPFTFFLHCLFSITAILHLPPSAGKESLAEAHVTLGQLPSLNQIPQGLLHHHFFSSCCLLS